MSGPQGSYERNVRGRGHIPALDGASNKETPLSLQKRGGVTVLFELHAEVPSISPDLQVCFCARQESFSLATRSLLLSSWDPSPCPLRVHRYIAAHVVHLFLI